MHYLARRAPTSKHAWTEQERIIMTTIYTLIHGQLDTRTSVISVRITGVIVKQICKPMVVSHAHSQLH